MSQTKIAIAGATGDLGMRIVKALLAQGADVHALVRIESQSDKIATLEKLGVRVHRIQWTVAEIAKACTGATCVISALAGLRDVVIDAQSRLLDGAIAAGVRRFIPSDYSLDFTPFSPGENRNLDLRREFHQYLDSKPIASTSIFNGAFADMLTGQMPLILFDKKWILYWGDADHPMCLTTMDDTAAYTAQVALDYTAPRYLHIAGDLISPRGLQSVMKELTGEKYRLFRPGGPALLSVFIKIGRTLAPAPNDLYPAWQGMQYMRNMIDKRADIKTLDNNRYPGMHWTTAKEVLSKFLAPAEKEVH